MDPTKYQGVTLNQPKSINTSYQVTSGGSTTLPYIRDSLPAAGNPRLGMARYYTMRSLGGSTHGGSIAHAPHNTPRSHKDVLIPTLPEIGDDRISHPGNNKTSEPRTGNYVTNHKNVMRLRGLTYTELFGSQSNRNKNSGFGLTPRPRQGGREPTLLEPLEVRHRNRKRGRRMQKTAQSECALPRHLAEVPVFMNRETQSVISALLTGDNTEGSSTRLTSEDPEDTTTVSGVSSEMDARKYSEIEARLGDMFDLYQGTPGWMPQKKISGRKLGNVVSSNRLSQLLNSKEPLKMENFYNYYP